MTREELKEYLNSTGEIHRPNQESKAWQRAFELARVHGYGDLDMGCAACWNKVDRFIRE